MIYIAHRGNINGKQFFLENKPSYIDNAIQKGYDVEVDIRYDSEYNIFWLGHDNIKSDWEKISYEWLYLRRNRLWIHCKNLEALVFFSLKNNNFHCFWHEKDAATLTNRGYIWAYPGTQPIEKSIAVLPELYDEKINGCLGICSDVIEKYRGK